MPTVPLKPLLSRSRGAVWLEELRRWCRRNTVLDSPDIRAVHSSAGVALLLNSGDARSAGASVAQYILKDANFPEHLVGSLITPFTSADLAREQDDLGEFPVPKWKVDKAEVKIARPREL